MRRAIVKFGGESCHTKYGYTLRVVGLGFRASDYVIG